MDDGGVGIAKLFLCWHGAGFAARRLGIGLVMRVDGYVKAGDLRDGDGAGVAGEQLDFIARGDFAFAGDGQVETGASTQEKALYHLI